MKYPSIPDIHLFKIHILLTFISIPKLSKYNNIFDNEKLLSIKSNYSHNIMFKPIITFIILFIVRKPY